MNIYRFDSDRNDDNKYTRAMYLPQFGIRNSA